MMASNRGPSAPARTKTHQGHALLTAALLSEIISVGYAFSMPVGLTSLRQTQSQNYRRESVPASNCPVGIYYSRKHAKKPLFAAEYYNDDDQWGDDTDSAYEQQAFMDNTSFQNFQGTEQRNYEGRKRAILGGAALGTMIGINNVVGMSAGAEIVAPVSNSEVSEQSIDSYSAVLNAQPEVALPYLEKQIQAAEEAYGNIADPYESSASFVDDAAASSSETTASFSPSFVRYTQEHMADWIETGHKVYDSAAPKVIAGGQKIVAEVDKHVTPMVIEKEHQLLGYENSAVLDKTLSNVASAGEMIAGMVGKAISFGINGGIQVAKATPEVIKAGQQVYKTMDEKIIPEVVDTTMKMKIIVDKTIPEVMDTSKHAYDTLLPEFMSAEKQIASTVKSGVDMAMPTVKDIENKLTPELSKIQRGVLGEERAAMVEKTVADVTKQGKDAIQTVGKTVPQVVATGQKTVDTVAYTGLTAARAVPVMIESGKQAYNSVDRSISGAISTTQDIASDLDRAAGKTAYAIEGNFNVVTGTIDKTLPAVLEIGRQAAVSGSEIAKSVESGSKAIYGDVSEFVEDRKVDNTINRAGKRFAATNPVFKEVTASVNDPNQLGKL